MLFSDFIDLSGFDLEILRLLLELPDFYTQHMNLAEKSPCSTQMPCPLIFWMLIPERHLFK